MLQTKSRHRTDTGNTALHLAAALGHRLMVKRLLDQRDLQLSTLSVAHVLKSQSRFPSRGLNSLLDTSRALYCSLRFNK